MKPFFTFYKKILLFSFVLFASIESYSSETPAILREWAAYSGISDSTYKTPVLTENDYSYVATVEENTVSGADIVVIKYNNNGISSWKQPWTGVGFGRDQAADMVMDSLYLYICGTTFSATTNFDYVVIKMQKANGAIEWTRTFNGTANNYDIATAIAINDSSIYVTGVTSSLNSLLDYHTLKYHINGTLLWSLNFDYNNLLDIPFAISYSQEDSNIIVTGGSQSSIYDWDYQTNIYKYNGTTVDLGRVSGTSVGFDRATAVKTDSLGNIYITGATRENNSNFDIKTVKLDKLGNLIWQRTFDNNGGNDIANDLVVNNVGEIYLVGTIEGNGSDYLVMRLDASNGGIVWQNTIDCGANDTARAICFDSHGNIVITGQVFNPENTNYDFLTINYDRVGQELWRDYFDGPDHGDDNATNIASDNDGNIFVTGQTWVGNDYHSVTIKYKTDFFTQPPAVDTPSIAYLFYPNSGQLINTDDSLVTESVHYYTLHHSPQLYFGYGMMNMVWSHVDEDTATADTLQRVDVTFANSTNPTEAYPIDEDTSSYLNYFLGHCPNGITNVHGSASLLFTDVYPDIDVLYSSNNAGLKLLFIINPGASIPQEMGLAFAGDNGISVLNNWGLNVHTSLGDYEFEKPHAYQIDTSGNRVTLPWHLNWNIPQSGQANFIGWGSFNSNLPLVIEITKPAISASLPLGNLNWSTNYGGLLDDVFNDAVKNKNSNIVYATGTTGSSTFPINNGVTVYQQSIAGGVDAIVTCFDELGALNWATFIGSPDGEWGRGIAVDSQDNIYVVGYTTSFDQFPVFDYGSGAFFQSQAATAGPPANTQEGFIFEITPNGQTRIWATYFGGGDQDFLEKAKIDANDNLFVVGTTTSEDFPHALQIGIASYQQDCTVYATFSCSVVNGSTTVTTTSTTGLIVGSLASAPGIPSGTTITAITSSTTFTISNQATSSGTVTINFKNGNADAIISKFNVNHFIRWSTCYGGNATDGFTDIDIDPSNNIFTTGITKSSNFPTENPGNAFFDGSLSGLSDAIIVKFDNNGDRLYSTFYGGNGDERGGAGWWYGLPLFDRGVVGPTIITNSNGDIFLTGTTSSTDNAMILALNGATNQPSNGGGNDAWLAKFGNNLNRVWGTYYGGNGDEYGNDLCFDNNGILYLTGSASFLSNTAFPTTNPAGSFSHTAFGGFDCFIASFDVTLFNDWGTFFGGGLAAWPNLFSDDFAVTAVYNGGHNQIITFGGTQSADYLLENQLGTFQYYQPIFGGPGFDGCISRFETGTWINVEELKRSNISLSIFPNPTNNIIIIHFLQSNYEKMEINISTLIGQNIYSKIVYNGKNNNNLQINVSTWPAGVYLVSAKSENKISTSKFIRQ